MTRWQHYHGIICRHEVTCHGITCNAATATTAAAATERRVLYNSCSILTSHHQTEIPIVSVHCSFSHSHTKYGPDSHPFLASAFLSLSFASSLCLSISVAVSPSVPLYRRMLLWAKPCIHHPGSKLPPPRADHRPRSLICISRPPTIVCHHRLRLRWWCARRIIIPFIYTHSHNSSQIAAALNCITLLVVVWL